MLDLVINMTDPILIILLLYFVLILVEIVLIIFRGSSINLQGKTTLEIFIVVLNGSINSVKLNFTATK